MAWTAPATWSTGQIVTAAELNEQVRDNEIYLKAEADKAILEDGTNPFAANQPMGGFKLTGLAAAGAAGESVRFEQLAEVSWAEPARALDTEYQNGTKMRLVVITCSYTSSTMDVLYPKIGVASPPLTIVARAGITAYGAGTFEVDIPAAFIVPPSWYYNAVVGFGTPTFREWHEWDLH